MPIATELDAWVPRFVERLQTLPQLRDVASDQQNDGLQTRLAIDRDTASRLGITPQTIDDDAVRRVRPAADLDDVHAAEPVPRGARSRSRRSRASPDALQHIYVSVVDRRVRCR